jgi:tRNA dimethylallyltransferase
MRRFIVIAGPTASGKTRVAVEVAKRLGSEIVSADSMQIYRGLVIGTAKTTAEEMRGVRHHLIDIVEPDEAYTTAHFQRDAFSVIDALNNRGVVPIVAGGTGLYINSLVYDLDFSGVKGDAAFRQKLTQLADDKGLESLYNMLSTKDPAYAAVISSADRRRIIRRLEIIETSGPKTYDFIKLRTGIETVMIGLTMPRDMLYRHIEARVDRMVKNGLVEEARMLYNKYGQVCALKAIGYKELDGYFRGNGTLDEAISLIKRNSRRYAKRQLTWFKRDNRIRWFDVSQYPCIEDIADDIMSDIRRKGF